MKEKNKKLISEVIKDIEHDMTDEEILSLLASSKVSENTSKSAKDEYSFGQRMADKIAKFAGSWGFIFSFVAVLILWMAVNILLADGAFDAYPFILLNLVLRGGNTGAADNDEPEPAGGKGPPTRRERL